MFTKGSDLIKLLEKNGFSAFFVGGCVRDMILKADIHDVDIATSALPEEIMDVFSDLKVLPTGILHGTVTVIYKDIPFEITTFRSDGKYDDGRHPSSVSFENDIVADLARRDFTINAMAFHPDKGILDPYGGTEDLKKKIIRCVGNPEDRFSEDGLRILRCLRFSSSLGFNIDPITQNAIFDRVNMLKKIAPERIFQELKKIIMGDNIAAVITEYSEIFASILTFLNNKIDSSASDMLNCTACAIGLAKKDLYVRLSIFFMNFEDPNQILKSLKVDNTTLNTVLTLIKYHDISIEDTIPAVHRWCYLLGTDILEQILYIKNAQISSIDPSSCELKIIIHQQKILNDLIKCGVCMHLSDLAVNGNDMLRIGYRGEDVGTMLHRLMDLIIDEKLENIHDALMSYAQAAFDLTL